MRLPGVAAGNVGRRAYNGRMFHVRRHDHSPRVELLPLIDVIFLLLTFFIYSLILTVRADILPVQLVPVGGGQQAEPGRAAALTIDAEGQLYFDREPVAMDLLAARLDAFAAQPDRPPLFVALEEDGRTDRGPLLVKLIEMLRDAGITDVSVVGPPTNEPSTPLR
jgi:biopolymer transport protein ExbD